MKQIHAQTVSELIELSRLLGEFGQIKRATLLPDGSSESDSHHSFSLSLIAFELASQYAPALNSKKILLYSLVHDLPELITGDMQTLTATPEQLRSKVKSDEHALVELRDVSSDAPHIIAALEAYEKKEDEESLFVYWVDKLVTIPTHFYDEGANLHALGVTTKEGIKQWYERTLAKLHISKRTPHTSAVEILELAYQKMHDELFEE